MPLRGRRETSRISCGPWMGKDEGRRAPAGFMEGQEQASLRAAIFLLCGRSDWRGGRHASQGRTVTIVVEKQLVTQRRTLFEKTESLSRDALVGMNRSVP